MCRPRHGGDRPTRNNLFLSQHGHRRTDLTGRPLRFIRVRDFLIAYAPDEKPLWVIAVTHGHRVMAAVLRGWEER